MRGNSQLVRLMIAAILAGAITFAAVELARPRARATVPAGGGMVEGPPGQTAAAPLFGDESKTTLSAAECTLGASVSLPNTGSFQSTNAGPVWELSGSN